MLVSLNNAENISFTVHFPCSLAQLTSSLEPRRPAGSRDQL